MSTTHEHAAMESVNVSGLKNNPTEALRKAEQDVVVVMKRERPHAVMVSLAITGSLDVAGVKSALATALFRDGHLSLARAARVAEMPLTTFIAHVSRLGIPVVHATSAEVDRDMDTLEDWLASS